MSDGLTQMRETGSYSIRFGRMEKAFEHCGIFLIPSFSVSLPSRQAFRTISQSIYCKYSASKTLTC